MPQGLPPSFRPISQENVEDTNLPPSFRPISTEVEIKPEEETIWQKTKRLGSRLLVGPSEEENEARITQRWPEYAAEVKKAGAKFSPVNPLNEESLLPKLKQPETYWSGFGNQLYEDFIRPLASGPGILGSSKLGKVPIRQGVIVPPEPPTGLPNIINGISGKGLAEAPPYARTSQLGPGARFIAGPAGIAERGETYPLDLGAQVPYPGQQGAGTILPQETGEVTRLGAEDAARLGTQIGKIPQIRLPKKGEVINLNDLNEQIRAATKRPTQIGEPPEFNIGNVGPVEQPTAPIKLSRIKKEIVSEEKPVPGMEEAKPEAKVKTGEKSTIVEKAEAPKYGESLVEGHRPIAENETPRKAILQWAWGRSGAKVRGANVARTFEDLSGPDLIDKFEAGDRTGRLADVQKYFDQRHAESVKLGFLDEDQKRLNYLRHYFTQGPEDVTAAYKRFVATNPQFAKLGRFPTYQAAEASGLSKKYNTIPEIIKAYETEFQTGMRNKELRDYLLKTGQLAKGSGAMTTQPQMWQFKGANAKQIADDITNYFAKSPEGLHNIASLFRWSKNLSLGSGIPKTPLNMHYFNTLTSKWSAQGISALGDYFKGTFKPSRDISYLKGKSDFIADLVDHGMGWEDIEDHSALAREATNNSQSFIKRVGSWISSGQQRIFEDPLFKIRLPAAKVELAERIFKEQLPKVGKEKALDLAAEISNNFMGGLNKVLRNKTYKDLASIGLIAPDWLESRWNLASKGVKALVGKENPIYAKALGRTTAIAGAGIGTGVAAYNKVFPSERASNAAVIPAGQTSTGLNRGINVLGTASEGVRIPLELASAATSNNESTLGKISNLATGRLSAPFKAGADVVFNRDYAGNPLYGKDRYGKNIPTLEGIGNVGGELASPFIPPWARMLTNLVKYGMNIQQETRPTDIEREIGQGLELPLRYNTEPKPSRYREGR